VEYGLCFESFREPVNYEIPERIYRITYLVHRYMLRHPNGYGFPEIAEAHGIYQHPQQYNEFVGMKNQIKLFKVKVTNGLVHISYPESYTMIDVVIEHMVEIYQHSGHERYGSVSKGFKIAPNDDACYAGCYYV